MSYRIIGKYINKLDFNIPNPKTFFLLSKNISNYKINIDIKSNQVKDRIIDVQISLGLTPTKNDFEKIITNIVYSVIIELENEIKDKKDLEKIVLVEVPEKVYPELRKIFVFIFEKSGFKEIKISENVDFQKLYNLKKIQ